jgi:hypothetical protein
MGIYATELAEVRLAITQVLTLGQATGFNGQALTKASLQTLMAEKARLEPLALAEAARETSPNRGRNRLIRISF